jgi:hypothetical protein
MKIFTNFTIFLLFFSLTTLTAFAQSPNSDPQKDERATKITAKAFRQDGFFCGYWNDCEDDGPCDGLYSLYIKIGDEIFPLTIDLPNKNDESAVFKLSKGTPINFDFKVHYLYDESGEDWRNAISLTRVQVTGSPNPQACIAK